MGFFMGFPTASAGQPSGYPAVLRSAEYNGSPQPGAPHAASTGLASFSLWNTLYNTMFSSSLETNVALDAPYFDVRSKNMICAPYWNEPGISASVKQVWFPAFCVKKVVDQEGGHRLLSPSAWQILPSGSWTLLWTSIFNKYIYNSIIYIYIIIYIYKSSINGPCSIAHYVEFNKWPLATVPSISGYCVTRGQLLDSLEIPRWPRLHLLRSIVALKSVAFSHFFTSFSNKTWGITLQVTDLQVFFNQIRLFKLAHELWDQTYLFTCECGKCAGNGLMMALNIGIQTLTPIWIWRTYSE